MAGLAIDATPERPRTSSESPQEPAFHRLLPDRRNHASREQLLQRVRAEFDEWRGLKLTLAQAQRLFDLREDVCQRVLNTLVRAGLLHVQPDDLYARRDVSVVRTGCERF